MGTSDLIPVVLATIHGIRLFLVSGTRNTLRLTEILLFRPTIISRWWLSGSGQDVDIAVGFPPYQYNH